MHCPTCNKNAETYEASYLGEVCTQCKKCHRVLKRMPTRTGMSYNYHAGQRRPNSGRVPKMPNGVVAGERNGF